MCIPSRLALVELYLFFIAKIFSFMGISSFKKLSNSLTPYLSIIYLSFNNFSSYYKYFIYYWSPPIYYYSKTFWVGFCFKLLMVCSKFFLGNFYDLPRSCPSTFLVGYWYPLLFAVEGLTSRLILPEDLYKLDPSNTLLVVTGTFKFDWYIDWVVFLITLYFS